MTKGAKKDSRRNQPSLRARCASRANARPSTTSGGVLRMVNHAVFHSESQALASPNASAQLAPPIQETGGR